MPRRKGVPGYRLHKPSGQGRVIIDGRHVYLGPFGSPESREKYQAIVREHLAERARAALEQSVGPVADVTINEVMLRYDRHVESYYRKNDKPTSQVLLIRLSLGVVREKFGDLEASRFGPKALKECQQEYVRQGLSREECNRRVRLVRQFFKWMVGEELIEPKVLHKLKDGVPALLKGRTTAPERPDVRPVPDVYLDATLPHMPRVVAAMVQVQRWTGARPAEVVQMRGGDLTMSGPVWEFRPGTHKLDHRPDIDRILMVGPKAQEVIRPWLKPDLSAYLFDSRDWRAEQREANAARRVERGGKLYPSQRRRLDAKRKTTDSSSSACYTVAAYRRAIHRACDAAGVPRFSPNQIRHATATRLRREVGLDAARVVLGHGDSSTTVVYAARDVDLARETMGRLG